MSINITKEDIFNLIQGSLNGEIASTSLTFIYTSNSLSPAFTYEFSCNTLRIYYEEPTEKLLLSEQIYDIDILYEDDLRLLGLKGFTIYIQHMPMWVEEEINIIEYDETAQYREINKEI